jgi:hypothetical protein
MISLESARALIDFGGQISEDAAEQQLRGAVALHNLLERNRVAYLADEVGMGKTYVALGYPCSVTSIHASGYLLSLHEKISNSSGGRSGGTLSASISKLLICG